MSQPNQRRDRLKVALCTREYPPEAYGGGVFVPFRDATSGSETYGAGRYVEVSFDSEAQDEPLELDFNYAYNPSCVFSPAYDCPYPPRQNLLTVPIRAGEKLPYDEAQT